MAQPTGDAGAPTPPTPLDGDPPSARRRSEFQRRAQATLLLEVAIADVTLGCHNRAYLVHRARDEIARRARYGQRLSLLLLTADGEVGPDEDALKAIVAAANLALRPTDTLARWQGSDLVVLLPSTGLAGASRLARRLCTHVAASGTGNGPGARREHRRRHCARQAGRAGAADPACQGRPRRGARCRRRAGRHRLSGPTSGLVSGPVMPT